MPPKRKSATKRKADAVDDDASASAAAASPKAAAASSRKKTGSKGVKAARRTKAAEAEEEDADAAASDMPDEEADAEPSSSSSRAAAAAASSSSSAAAAAAPAAPKLKGKAAKFAAALASSASLPINRCDADSLSLIFSFLNTRDFLAAIAVNQSFRSARMKHTAWPKLNLDSFTQSLRDDNYSDNARRRMDMHFETAGAWQKIRLGAVATGRTIEQVQAEYTRIRQIRTDHGTALQKAIKAGTPAPELPQGLTDLLTTPAAVGGADSSPSMWRHVTDLRLRVDSTGWWNDGIRDLEVALLQLTLFPYASAINISAGISSYDTERSDYQISREVIQRMYQRLAEVGRVEAMLLFAINRSFLDGLTLVAPTLKVLVLDCQPPAAAIAALVHLVYIHFEGRYKETAVAPAVELGMMLRWLSVSHALRSLSVASNQPFYANGLSMVLVPPFIVGATAENGGPKGADQNAVALAAATAEGAPSAAALPRVDWSKQCGLTDITLTAVLTQTQRSWLPRMPLTRLQLGPGPSLSQSLLLPPSELSKLSVLRLELGGNGYTIEFVTQCTQLRVLQLSGTASRYRWAQPHSVSAYLVREVMRANVDTLEEMRVGANLRVRWADIAAPLPPSSFGFGGFGAGAAFGAAAHSAAGWAPFGAGMAAAAGFGSFGSSAFGTAAASSGAGVVAANAFGVPAAASTAVGAPSVPAAAAAAASAASTPSTSVAHVPAAEPSSVAAAAASGGAAPAASADAVSSSTAAPAAASTPSDAPACASTVAPLDLRSLAARDWPMLLACTHLRVVEITLESLPLGFTAALACLPSFHTLDLLVPAPQFHLPSNLAECVSHSASWSNVCLSLHESSALNLLRISGGLMKLLPPDALSEAAKQRLRVYGLKEGKRQVLAIQTDKKGARRWASIEGPFATVVV